MEEKYNQVEDETTSDTSDKSKVALGATEKKPAVEPKKEVQSEPPANPSSSTSSKVEPKEENDDDSDREDPHGNCKFIKIAQHFVSWFVIWNVNFEVM